MTAGGFKRPPSYQEFNFKSANERGFTTAGAGSQEVRESFQIKFGIFFFPGDFSGAAHENEYTHQYLLEVSRVGLKRNSTATRTEHGNL